MATDEDLRPPWTLWLQKGIVSFPPLLPVLMEREHIPKLSAETADAGQISSSWDDTSKRPIHRTVEKNKIPGENSLPIQSGHDKDFLCNLQCLLKYL